METIAVPLLLSIGALLALQAAANVQLAAALSSPFGAATLQLGLAAGLLLAGTSLAGALAAFGLLADAAPWHLAGGLGSAVYITAGIVLFPRLGAVVAVGLFIAGQMAASLLLDGFGWFNVEPEGFGLASALGTAAIVAGVALIVRSQNDEAALGETVRDRAGWAALGLVAGAVLPIQGAINAQLRTDLHEPIAVGAFSFVVAALAMGALLALVLALGGGGAPRAAGLERLPWWGWLGGACGAAYVVSVFAFIPEIGVAPTIALTVAGQQMASVLVDRYGVLRLPRRRISTRRLAGVAVLLAGVALIQLF
jgi:transporter family-2 protein